MKNLIKMAGAPKLLAAVVCSCVTALAVAQGTDDELTKKLRAKWTPGTPIPVELLTNFPCHSYELPCGIIPPRPIERPVFKEPLTGDPKRGEKIALDLRWGNCVACHELPGNPGGTIAPSLAQYAQKGFPHSFTYQRIWDVRAINQDAHMPLYGTNRVLTEDEIRDVMTYLEVGQQK